MLSINKIEIKHVRKAPYLERLKNRNPMESYTLLSNSSKKMTDIAV